ncbi:hypothetical protein ACW5R3_08165 [Bizionia sp. KMM 8389]
MKKLHYILIYGFAILVPGTAWSQIDMSPNMSTSIPARQTESGSDGFSIKPTENNQFSNPNTGTLNGLSIPNNSTLNTEKEKFSMFGEEFGNPGELYEERFNRHEENFNNIYEEKVVGAKTDQYLGDFKTKESRVRVLYRDYGSVDGDVIRVFVDKDIMKANAVLTGDYRGFVLELKEGFNVIDFQALTQGDVAPNTAQVVIMDENDEIIASSGWGLANGVKATLIVVKE